MSRPIRHHFGITAFGVTAWTDANLFYNVACCESLAGRTADAIAHLRRAVDMSDGLRALAKDDSDFDPIRDEPAFKELIGRQ